MARWGFFVGFGLVIGLFVTCHYWAGTEGTAPEPDRPTSAMRPPGTNMPNSVSDYDDGIGWVWRPHPGADSSGVPADFVVSVEINSLQGGTYVANVLQDHNMSGNWDTASQEWVIVNHVFNVGSGFQTVDLPAVRFPVPGVPMPECFWTCVTVTDAPREFSGSLGEGEIEDILLHSTPRAGNCISPQPIN